MSENNDSYRKKDPAQERNSRRTSSRRQLLVVLVLLIGGSVVTYLLVTSRKPPQKVRPRILPPLVETKTLRASDITMEVRGFGTVKPVVQVEVVPQVSGNIVFVNPHFKAGGFIKAGRLIARIDPRDYELAVQQAQSAVSDAEVKLAIEDAEAEVARAEWEKLKPGTEPPSPLVLRRPQLRQAQLNLEAARAKLAQAKLNLERTEISLPFDVVVISKKVNLGQFVSTGQSIGTAYGIEMVEIEVPLEDRELAWFDIDYLPGATADANGMNRYAKALVTADFAGKEYLWEGYVRRTTGQVDRDSRLVTVVIEVPRPFEYTDTKPPLLPGTFVEVVIKGKTVHNAFAVPREALHNGKEIWTVDGGHLYIQTVDIVRTDKKFAYVVSGLSDPVTIVTGSLDAVTNGMKVRTIDGDAGKAIEPGNGDSNQ